MQKGNYGNSVQVCEGEGIEERTDGKYSDNRRLIGLAQSGGEEGESASEQIVLLNRGLVRSIALRFRERGMELEDLIQIGTIGLIKAIRSFDLERGTCFSTYAVPMIFGEIRRALRDEGPIKIGRYYKKLGVELMHAKNRICESEGREPGVRELAEAVGVSLEEAAIALDSMSPICSFSELVYGEEDGTELGDTLADKDGIDENERLFDRIALREAIAEMPAQWQRIVALRYYRNKTQEEVGKALGLSQVKVSREEKKIVEFLREKMRGI